MLYVICYMLYVICYMLSLSYSYFPLHQAATSCEFGVTSKHIFLYFLLFSSTPLPNLPLLFAPTDLPTTCS